MCVFYTVICVILYSIMHWHYQITHWPCISRPC